MLLPMNAVHSPKGRAHYIDLKPVSQEALEMSKGMNCNMEEMFLSSWHTGNEKMLLRELS